MTTVAFPGTFDPVTLGHEAVARRAADIFGRLIVCVAAGLHKKTVFSHRERTEMARKVFAADQQNRGLAFRRLARRFFAAARMPDYFARLARAFGLRIRNPIRVRQQKTRPVARDAVVYADAGICPFVVVARARNRGFGRRFGKIRLPYRGEELCAAKSGAKNNRADGGALWRF